MDISEKARAYDRALERAKALYSKGAPDSLHLEEMFPELAESKDEKIRKWLLDTITQIPNHSIEWEVINKTDVLAWLEQQKEYVSTDFDYVWERTDCGSLTSSLDKYSEEAIKKVCHAWYDKGIELERKSWLKKDFKEGINLW